MALANNLSCVCANSCLDLFVVPGTQVSIEHCSTVDYHPISALTHGLPIEFSVNGSGEHYIDLANTQLFIRAKILKSNGEPITDTDEVSTVNLTLQSLFSEIDFKINDTLVSGSNNMYPYRAYLETLLNYGKDAKSSQLVASMYAKDEGGKFDDINPLAANANTGLVKRYKMFKTGSVEMCGKLHLDLMAQERLIPSDCGMRLRLIPAKDQFTLLAANNSGFKLHIEACNLLVRKVKISPSVLVGHAKGFERANAKYPIKKVQMKTMTVTQGVMDFSLENVFTGQLPSRLIIGMVDNDAFNGVYQKNCYNFKNYNLAELKVTIDGTDIIKRPIHCDYRAGHFVSAYLSLFQATGKLGKDLGTDITLNDYPNGYCLYGFDLTPDENDDTYFNLVREGSLRIEAKFRESLPQTINIVIYSETESILELTRSRNVLIDN
jgi:hypothetical protein